MPEEVGKLCEEGFQITAWKGMYAYIGIRQSCLVNQYHSKCTPNNTVICVLNITALVYVHWWCSMLATPL